MAHKGTLFLDEIGDLPLELQPKLLRVLQDQGFERVGSSRTIKADVRVIAATHCDLARMVEEGKFRSDLYYRLNIIPLVAPPLRERGEDIILLARYFARKYADRLNKRFVDFPTEVIEALASYDWPGNVRELQNVIERIAVNSGSEPIQPEDLPSEIKARRVGTMRPKQERRRTIADDLYQRLVEERQSFWSVVYPLYMQREITRSNVRDVVRKGLQEARGNYKIVARLFNMEQGDYKRFLNFLRKHDCQVPFKEYR